MPPQNIQEIPLSRLSVDLLNPRHVPQVSEREALATIALDQGAKLVNLARDIVENGLNPSELPLVAVSDNGDRYDVLEGNRRIAALKLITSPSFVDSLDLPGSLSERYKALHKAGGATLPTTINCSVLSREDANHWILLKHTGENDGVGIVPWDGRATQRFRGSSAALQAIELVEESDYIDHETRQRLQKIAITNIERVLNTPDARRLLGVDIKNGHLILVEEDALARLAIVVSDVANKEVKVTDLDSKDQRVNYAQRVVETPLPQKGGDHQEATSHSGHPASKSSAGRRINPDRKTLIPRQLKLNIPQMRINRIYHELQRLNVNDYVNCCSVMIRVFIEMSVDHYAYRKGLKLTKDPKPGSTQPPREMYLREKIAVVAKHLEDAGISDKEQLRGVRSLLEKSDDILSLDSLHAYIHNQNFHPSVADLKTNWDNIQPFIEALWSV